MQLDPSLIKERHTPTAIHFRVLCDLASEAVAAPPTRSLWSVIGDSIAVLAMTGRR